MGELGLKRKQEECGIEEDPGRRAVLCGLREIEEGEEAGCGCSGHWFLGGTQMCGDMERRHRGATRMRVEFL